MPAFTVDEGLQTLINEWKKEHPRATVYTIADDNHSQNPRVSQHARDDGKSGGPGDTVGEVDAGDFMPGKGVTDAHLDDLAEGLRQSRDKRLLLVIRRQRMFSSYAVAGYPAWSWRPYGGNYHGHTHVSVNDLFKNNQSDWNWEKEVPREIVYVEVEKVKIPELRYGDDDAAQEGWNPVMRAQALLNLQNDKGIEHLDPDGVYGAKTMQMVKAIFGGDGRMLTVANMRKLHGI